LHNDKEIEVNGTSLVGEDKCNYNDLKRIFGKPSMEMVTSGCQWRSEFEDGKEVATIYNYKDGKNYNGKSGLPKRR
jgi:hypothetical protein